MEKEFTVQVCGSVFEFPELRKANGSAWVYSRREPSVIWEEGRGEPPEDWGTGSPASAVVHSKKDFVLNKVECEDGQP